MVPVPENTEVCSPLSDGHMVTVGFGSLLLLKDGRLLLLLDLGAFVPPPAPLWLLHVWAEGARTAPYRHDLSCSSLLVESILQNVTVLWVRRSVPLPSPTSTTVTEILPGYVERIYLTAQAGCRNRPAEMGPTEQSSVPSWALPVRTKHRPVSTASKHLGNYYQRFDIEFFPFPLRFSETLQGTTAEMVE